MQWLPTAMMQAVRLLLTLTGMVAPDAAIMSAMGWTSAIHFALLGAWALISTALMVSIPDRHRRPDLRKRTAILTLVGWVTLGAMVLGTGWNVRPVVTTLLLLPGLNYLLLEAVGLTPKPAAPGSPLP
jgi:CHASE2 domain-containing sensor protein